MIKLKAPEGYKLHDTRTDREYTEVVTDEKNRDRFRLVPEQEIQTEEITINE